MSDNNYAVWDLINAEIKKANTSNIEYMVCGNAVANITMYNKVIEPFNTNIIAILRNNNIEYHTFNHDMKNTTLRDKHMFSLTVAHPGITDDTYNYTARIYVDASKPINDDGASKIGFDRLNPKK